jgi:hypothetical protein
MKQEVVVQEPAATIFTCHPDERSGIRISKALYEEITGFIIQSIRESDQITLPELLGRARAYFKLRPAVDINWCVYHVKLNLEAKRHIRPVNRERAKNSTAIINK